MSRGKKAVWMVAFGTAMMILAAQPHGAQQKRAAAKPAAAQKAAAKRAPTTTLTGCLMMEGNEYKLTNLKGAQAPMGRTWKSGFIKKSKKDVEVVSASTDLKLWDHVNRQVSVVGIKDSDTHLRVSSIKRVSGSCS